MFTPREQKVLLLLISLVVIGLIIILVRDYPFGSAAGMEGLEVFVYGDVLRPGTQIVKGKNTFREILDHAGISSTSSGRITLEAMEPEEVVCPSVCINKATREELISLPGIGPKLANNILLYRQQHGHFKKKPDLMKVKGIGIGKYGRIKVMIYLEEKNKGFVPGRLKLEIPSKGIVCDVGSDSTFVDVIEKYGLSKSEESKFQEIKKIPVRFKLLIR